MKAELLFDPDCGRKMSVVAFASGSGTNFEAAVKKSKEPDSNFSIDLLITDKEFKKSRERIGALNLADQHKVPHETINGFQYCGSWEKAKQTIEGREKYEQKSLMFNWELLQIIREYENQLGQPFDLALLAGYMRFMKGALLTRFTNHAINVHPADLTVREHGQRLYIGDDAVYDALKAGEKQTRSSIIIVNAGEDAGALLASGPWVEYKGPVPVTPDSADEHQEVQKTMSDHPVLCFTLEGIAKGDFALHKRRYHDDGNPVVVYRGDLMAYEGAVLE